MKTVRDDEGKRYLLLKQSGSASLVRDPATGNECYVGNDRLETDGSASALETAASGVDEPVRRLIRSVHDDRALGLVIELADRGPLSVRSLCSGYEPCESDLQGLLAELSAADVLEETDVGGERGYRVADDCARALAAFRRPIESGGHASEPDDSDAGTEPSRSDSDAEGDRDGSPETGSTRGDD